MSVKNGVLPKFSTSRRCVSQYRYGVFIANGWVAGAFPISKHKTRSAAETVKRILQNKFQYASHLHKKYNLRTVYVVEEL